MKLNKKILSLLILLIAGTTSLYARSYPVVTELPSKFYIKSVGSQTYMEAKGNEIKLYRLDENNKNQQWYAFKSGNQGDFRLRNRGAAKYLKIETKKTGKIIKKKHKYLGLNANYTKVKFLALSSSQFLIKVSGSEVADAQGGAKRNKQGQAVIPYGLNNGAGQKWYIYYNDGNRMRLFNYRSYAREKQAAQNKSNQPANNGGSKNSLSQSLNKYAISSYMNRATASQFRNENQGNILTNYINKQDEIGRYNFVDKVVSAASSNRDNSFRFSVYNELSTKVNLTSKDFTTRLLKGKLKKVIKGYHDREKYRPAKIALSKLMKKYD